MSELVMLVSSDAYDYLALNIFLDILTYTWYNTKTYDTHSAKTYDWHVMKTYDTHITVIYYLKRGQIWSCCTCAYAPYTCIKN